MTTHTCPICESTLHVTGKLEAWITQDGRVILYAASAKPTEQRWLELPASAQNWLAEILHLAHQATQEKRSADHTRANTRVTSS